ncbi:MAG TPA: S8 family serine peptidase [Methanotrichaceae archaeon]|nr:S8 family serine peptidase [Methanotrichaceae archaeon]
MERRELIFIAVSGLILVAIAMSAPPDMRSLVPVKEDGKIDQSLAERLETGNNEKISVIVVLKGQEKQDLKGFDTRYDYHLINGLAGEADPSTIRDLAKEDDVKNIYLDSSIKAAQESRSDTNATVSASKYVNADQLWAKGIDGKGVIVAIIDSGIDKNHPDLAGKVVGEKNFVPGEETTDDLLGHGTMVAGLIAGSGAASGGKYKGVAPGASLLNVRVIDSEGNGQVSDIIAGIEWALDNHAKVLSLSLAGLNLGETNPPVTMAADNAMDAGAVVCVAAGNNG